jgi:hypothetical protein
VGDAGAVSRIRRIATGTAPLPAGGGEPQEQPRPRAGAGQRLVGVATVLTTAVVVLAGIVVGAAVFAAFDDVPGPDTGEIAVHVAGGILGLALRRWLRRARLPLRLLLLLAVACDLAALLWFYWWR